MVKNTENKGGQGTLNTPETDAKATSVDMSSDELILKLQENKAIYPAWRPEKLNAILAGKIVDIKDYPFMHQGRGSVMAVVETGLEGDNANVAFWLNTVAQSQLLKLRNEGVDKDEQVTMDADFETRVAAIRELVGTDIIAQYQGEQKSEDKAKKSFAPYQKYLIVKR